MYSGKSQEEYFSVRSVQTLALNEIEAITFNLLKVITKKNVLVKLNLHFIFQIL